MKSIKTFAALSALLFLLCTGCSNGKNPKQASVSATGTGSKNDIVVWGEVKYSNEYQVNIDFPSTVENVPVQEGDRVTKGSTLITLSAGDYRKSLQKLNAQADSAKSALDGISQGALKAEIDTLKNQISTKTAELEKSTNPDLEALQTSLKQADKDVSDAQSDLQKYRKLFDSGAISQSDLDKYSDALDQKKNAESNIKDNIAKTKKALQDELDTLNTNLKYKQVLLGQQKDAAQAAADDLDTMSGKTQKTCLAGNSVVSNLNHGIVKNIAVVKGSVLGTQYMPQKVLDLIDADSLYVSAEVPEEFIGQISRNSKVYLVPTADKNLKIGGQVTRIANEATEKDGDRIVIVHVKPNDKNGTLKPGYTADVHFDRIRNAA